MARTQVGTAQILDTGVTRADLNVATSGSAVIAKVIQGTGITISATGADAGTGDATINASATAILDILSTTRGTILYRNATVWVALAPGTAGQVLKTNGAGADPSWATMAADLSTFHLVSAGSTNATSVKASAGKLYGWWITNTNAAARKLAFHNTAGTPTAGASLLFSLLVPGLGAANVLTGDPINFTTGIGITTTTGSADADAVAVASGDLVINLFYV